MKLKVGHPLTVLYRGDNRDTASLVGLAHTRANIGIIALTCDLTKELESYCRTLNDWLIRKGLPKISFHPILSPSELEHLVDRPEREWGWSESDCKAAILLSGLPLPPQNLAS